MSYPIDSAQARQEDQIEEWRRTQEAIKTLQDECAFFDEEGPEAILVRRENVQLALDALKSVCETLAKMESQEVEHLKAIQREERYRKLIHNPDESPLDRFERIGQMFYAATGHLRPGKDDPRETRTTEERQKEFSEWFDAECREALNAKYK